MSNGLEHKRFRNILIPSVIPYFLDRGSVWFEENRENLARALQTQPFFRENLLFLHDEQEMRLSDFLRSLDELGYEKAFAAQDPGEFSRAGDTVEVFPIASPCSFRIEFLGNAIERIEALPKTAHNPKETEKRLRRRLAGQRAFSDLRNIREGEYVVHLDHGIGVFRGVEEITDEAERICRSFYVLEYASSDRLFVPLGLERKLSRYAGFGAPRVSRLGSPLWGRTKRIIREEVEKLARELLALYASREESRRPPYEWDEELEKLLANSFPHEETPDQIRALEDIKADLRESSPMDRLVCGDVGFGKTEIAIRTAAMAARNGYQVAVLCPTTLLAAQHEQTFRDRLSSLPLRVESLSRLQDSKQAQQIAEDLKAGNIDIIIGTHRLFSQDIAFRRLGLLIVDDEHKFGVKQKELLKRLRSSLDVLSLSATPIPRTLSMALSSLRAISVIHTPPRGRLVPQTTVAPFDERIMEKAIRNELARNGQVYVLHNRVRSIEADRELLQKIVPEARIGIAHGRMDEQELLGAVRRFREGAYDVLLATTIIENGLHLPNVNTLVVEDASRLGLAQAYQLRGRVGRSDASSFAYFLHPRNPGERARKRLEALENARSLGDGYRIAMKDLEIRGAGNILGKEQSGSVNAVGLNLYCQMLSESVERIRANSRAA